MVACSLPLARAEVKLPSIFADHMVVQRNLPVHVWGMATPNETVSVTFRGETQNTTTGPLGRWSVYLKPGKAGGPFSMEIHGTNAITLQDVLVGDVWVASGQSNMEFPMAEGMNRGVNNEKAEIAAANYPEIRLMTIATNSSDYPLTGRGGSARRGEHVRPQQWLSFLPSDISSRETCKNISISRSESSTTPGVERSPRPGPAWMGSPRMHR